MSENRSGFVTMNGMGHLEPISKAGEMGFDFVEIQMDYVGIEENITGTEFMRREKEAMQAQLREDECGLMVHLPHGLEIGSPYESVRKAAVSEAKECIRAAADVGAEKGVVHPVSSARQRSWNDPSYIRNLILDSMMELDAFGEGLDFTVCLENLPHGYFSRDEFDVFFDRTDCSMVLDTGHAKVSGTSTEEFETFIERNAGRISHVHLNDVRTFTRDRYQTSILDEHLPFGAGDIDMGTIIDAFAAQDWEGTYSLEIQTLNYDYIDVSKNFLDQVLAG